MRLAAQEKMGFYPTPPSEGPGLLQHLKLGPPTERAADFHILDPCAGDGEIIKQIADGLHVPYKQVYAVELDRDRGVQIRAAMPGAQVLAPCSLFSTFISHRSFSLVYCNPPFDDGLGRGSGRDELQFAKEAYSLLTENGVIVLVAPLKTFKGRDFRTFVDCHFKDQLLYRFATPVYNEVVMFGRKRSNPLDEFDANTRKTGIRAAYAMDSYNREYDYKANRYRGINALADLPALGMIAADWVDGMPGDPHALIRVWDIPPCWKPSKFNKTNYLPEELAEKLEESENNALFRATVEPDIAEAPLPLAEGHVALLVASGALDGFIEVAGRPELNHVMRGISRKVEYHNEEAGKAVISEDGNSMRVTEVYSEQMDTKIRAVDKTNQIFTYELKPATSTSTKTREYEVKMETGEGEIGGTGSIVIKMIKQPGDSSDHVDIDCGGKTIRFCFDTGATICQLSPEAINGVPYFPTGRTMSLLAAAGQVSIGKEVVIANMRIGELVAKNVRCVVCENGVALLGQNFLKVFDYHYSQARGELTLTLAKKEDNDTSNGKESVSAA